MNAVACKYIKSVKKYLVCPAEYRNKYLKLLKKDLEACLEENPNASFRDLETLLGPPKSVAESYLEEIPSEVLKTYTQKRKWIARTAIVSGIVLIVALILLVAYMGHLRSGFTQTTRIIVDSSSEVSVPDVSSETVSSHKFINKK